MDGTTRCPHCETRFRIVGAQLETHHGMVRCGNCLQAFDARPGFIPDQPGPQLELPILDETAAPIGPQAVDMPDLETPQPAAIRPEEEATIADTVEPETTPTETVNLSQPLYASAGMTDEPQPTVPHPAKTVVLHPMTLAEQIAVAHDAEDSAPQSRRRVWPWAVAVLLLLLALLAQAAFYYRVDLAARLPGLKPALSGFCQWLKCSVPLPRRTDLMSIESSELEANPTHENLITLNALLRNRAPYAQAYPNLELTLNDTQDQPLARRIFKPADYLPLPGNEVAGLPANNEFGIKLNLDTTSLKPSGYRLVLFYPNGN